MTFELPAVEDTEAFGRSLGRSLRVGDVVLLSGPLGAGKTAMTRGIAAGLGVPGRVSSPTFAIARVHGAGPGGVGLVHVDAYRLGGDLAQLDDLDLDADLERSAVVVEWGEGTAERLSDDYLVVRIDRRDDDVRVVALEPHGAWAARLAELQLAG
ncbi:MAG: tRNA ((37)-N6)-threonylcarbamoyltransferase complex ATPase subunit type 1 TsaE [Amycolatopsis sp.]|jgi:tRNA threonylcarbamoyladenosine biosynthesis protein TsaE|uniref:tRNA (adenosine(37)-N6)-threonylcarbamoyltransferase complex ATPase subunit type 1 TsaE n=1 Tax=Amycolatopsis sp. TaxID=37632 RepID=UPI0026209CD2|nr:tRNA (adenosine(37)-N6)-threonylcarbamoyltransferase complex ATPase subunit type 1 TsaE [Amycolatopsis sp.]MCU1683458.1 tRNA ((37)-N6)-threonylcarbamoyltransferase complex ATPase subunit type 1 TsaE [Amycolatopsis sp.]